MLCATSYILFRVKCPCISGNNFFSRYSRRKVAVWKGIFISFGFGTPCLQRETATRQPKSGNCHFAKPFRAEQFGILLKFCTAKPWLNKQNCKGAIAHSLTGFGLQKLRKLYKYNPNIWLTVVLHIENAVIYIYNSRKWLTFLI